MAEYDNELTGVLFPNDRKGENGNAPDVTGKCEILGEEYRIAGWKRTSTASGKKFFSLKFENKADFDARIAQQAEESDPEGALEL